MILLRPSILMLCALGFFGCGGSQKAPDSAAPSTAPETASSAAQTSAPTADESPAAAAPELEPTPSLPECKKDEDCTIFADCCSCKAVAASKPLLVPCESVCGESKCEVKGMTIANVACDQGRCVLKKK